MFGGAETTQPTLGTLSFEDLSAMCADAVLDTLADDEVAGLAASFLAWWPRLEALRLRLVAAVDARGAYRVDGARDMTSWLAWKAGERRGVARRDVDVAAAVAAMPVVAAGLADGSLSKAKTVELARIPRATTEDVQALVRSAVLLTPEAVAREVDRYELEHPSEPVAVVESVCVTPLPGGGRLEATLHDEHLEWVQVAVDAAADHLGLQDIPWEQRRARGLVAVCRYFLDHADLPTRRHGRPTLVITMDVEVLAKAAGGSARLDSGAYLSGDTARRLSCDAGVVRLITDPTSIPLDVGRATRTVSPAQARAVIHRDRHCRYDGCSAPPWACDVHHIRHWSRGGGTSVDNLSLLCWHHHRQVHRYAETHDLVGAGGGRVLLRRRTSDADAA